MRKLAVFNQVSLDGYFVDQNGDMSWAHNPKDDEEWDAFVTANASSESMLVFGRITYELMIAYWPTPLAMQNDPLVAERMNNLPKVVFSRTLDRATWNNTKLIKQDPASAMRKMKAEPGADMVILGSGSLVAQLTRERLIDQYQVVVVPVVLGNGRTMFAGLEEKINLKLASSRIFNNGNVLLCLELLTG
jgi:dihydrofolate reductase